MKTLVTKRAYEKPECSLVLVDKNIVLEVSALYDGTDTVGYYGGLWSDVGGNE